MSKERVVKLIVMSGVFMMIIATTIAAFKVGILFGFAILGIVLIVIGAVIDLNN